MAKINVHPIGQYAELKGHTFALRAGIKVLIQKRVDDMDKKKSVYQGLAFVNKSVIEVNFDAKTLECVSGSDVTNAYQVSLDIDSLDLTNVPGVTF